MQGGRLEDDWAPNQDERPAEVVEQETRKAEAHNRAVVLEMIGDLPEADAAPPSNMLFVCKLNQVGQGCWCAIRSGLLRGYWCASRASNMLLACFLCASSTMKGRAGNVMVAMQAGQGKQHVVVLLFECMLNHEGQGRPIMPNCTSCALACSAWVA